MILLGLIVYALMLPLSVGGMCFKLLFWSFAAPFYLCYKIALGMGHMLFNAHSDYRWHRTFRPRMGHQIYTISGKQWRHKQ